MTPDQIIARLRVTKDARRLSDLARSIGCSPSLLSRIAAEKRPLTDDVRRRLMRHWAREDGRLAPVVAMRGIEPRPPTGELAEALRLRATSWSRETRATLLQIEIALSSDSVGRTVGEWIDEGDRIERSQSADDESQNR